MKYLKITNKGVLDVRLVALMGGTTKSKDEFKIGQFGTGLKYTLAYFIRNNVDFKIWAGEKETKIEIVTEYISGEDFNIICINGNRTSITDRMGLEWEAWMIIRELWCNALDEGGASHEIVDHNYLSAFKNEAETTTFFIQLTTDIKTVVDDWGKYFIHNVEPIFKSEQYAIYPGGETLRLYKQGVLIHEMKNKKGLFSYDMRNAPINELREYRGSASHLIYKCLQNANKKVIEMFMEQCNETHYEGSDMDYNWFEHLGSIWKETIGEAKIIHKEAIENIRQRGVHIETDGMLCVPKKVYEALSKDFEGVGALRVADKMNEFFEVVDQKVNDKIQQALTILEACGYNYHPELKFIVGIFGDKAINARVNFDSKEVFISEAFKNKSLFEVVYILVEENEHFNTGFHDCSRDFQTHFIKLYVQTLLEKNKIQL